MDNDRNLTQGERIKKLRKSLNLTAEEFGNKVGVTRTAISNIENNNRSVTEQMLKSVCREFGVNEEWLRNGTGEMFTDSEDDLFNKIDRIMAGESESHKNIIKALANATPEDIAALDRIVDRYIALRNGEEIEIADDLDDIPDTPEELEALYPPIDINKINGNENAG